MSKSENLQTPQENTRIEIRKFENFPRIYLCRNPVTCSPKLNDLPPRCIFEKFAEFVEQLIFKMSGTVAQSK